MNALPQADLSKGLKSLESLEGLATTVTLNDGNSIPILGLGTSGLDDEMTAIHAVKKALELGYRHLDTASFYNNEVGVGKGIAASGIARDRIFITTKVWTTEQGYDATLQACAGSLKRLNVEMIDLYLIHWPKPEHTLETWRAMKELKHAGKIRSLGVSNFTEKHLEVLLAEDIIPTVNQVELHPQFPQSELKAFCERHHIYLEGWSPLVRGKIFEMKPLQAIAKKYGKTVAQVALRWQIQRNIITIPKTSNPLRMQENSDIFDFELSEEDFTSIATLRGERIWDHPDTIDF